MSETACLVYIGSWLGLERTKHTYIIIVSRHQINLMGYATLCNVQSIYSVRYDIMIKIKTMI